MASALTAQVSPGFSTPESTARENLSIEFGLLSDLNPVSSVLSRSVRIYPDTVGILVRCTEGTITYQSRSSEVQNEYISFQNSTSASTKFPMDNNTVSYTVEFAYDIEGNTLTSTPIITYIPDTNQLTSNVPFIGAVRITYTATYRVYEYVPTILRLPSNLNSGIDVKNGQVLAFKNSSFAILDVPVNEYNLESFQPQKKELYRVTSIIQVTPGGAYELHPTFDTGGRWSVDDDAPDPEDDNQPLLSSQRVHEIGYVNANSKFLDYDFVDVRLQKKDDGGVGASFKPVLTVDFRGASEFIEEAWADTYQSLDKNEIKDAINGRYQGYTINYTGEG